MGINALTILSEGNQEKNVSQKANFESMGTFKGIRGLSKDLNGLSALIDQEDGNEDGSKGEMKIPVETKK